MNDRRRPARGARPERGNRSDRSRSSETRGSGRSRAGGSAPEGVDPDGVTADGLAPEDVDIDAGPGEQDSIASDDLDTDDLDDLDPDDLDPDDGDPGDSDVADADADDSDPDDPDGDEAEGGRRQRGGRSTRSRARARRAARPPISGMRVLVGTIVAIAVVVVLFLVAYFTPLMSVRTVAVTGNSVVSEQEITTAAAIPAGEPLLQVDAESAARRVSMIPRVATVRVKREYPSTISIAVVERVAVVSTERDGQKYLMDKLGFEFAQQDPPPGLPQLRTQNPGSGDLSTRAALTVLAQVPPYVAEQVAAIEVSSPVNIVLVLKDKRTVVWGDDSRNAEKAETLRHVLTQEGTEYNVSSPSNPTFK